MSKTKAALKMALDALKNGKRVRNCEGGTKYQPTLEDEAITAILEAIAEQEQEPIYQLQLLNGNWIDQSKTSYEYNLRNGVVGLRVVYAHPAPANQQASEQSDHATIAGLESCVNTLNALVDEQRALLVDVERECGTDGYGDPYEDGESQIIDRVRSHLGMTAAPEAPAWQELSEEEITFFFNEYEYCDRIAMNAISAALRAKNGGGK